MCGTEYHVPDIGFHIINVPVGVGSLGVKFTDKNGFCTVIRVDDTSSSFRVGDRILTMNGVVLSRHANIKSWTCKIESTEGSPMRIATVNCPCMEDGDLPGELGVKVEAESAAGGSEVGCSEAKCTKAVGQGNKPGKNPFDELKAEITKHKKYFEGRKKKFQDKECELIQNCLVAEGCYEPPGEEESVHVTRS